jgi:catechol 2,3-dioxygenase-like lactoylglutathione lyase family enzyme
VSVDWKLELVVVPVSDLDRAKAFYTEQAGFLVDVDRQVGPDFRVVQLSPPGSACSIFLSPGSDAAGSVQGLHLIVSDIEAARAELVARGTGHRRRRFGGRGSHHPARRRRPAGWPIPDTLVMGADRGRGILVQGGDPRCRCSR